MLKFYLNSARTTNIVVLHYRTLDAYLFITTKKISGLLMQFCISYLSISLHYYCKKLVTVDIHEISPFIKYYLVIYDALIKIIFILYFKMYIPVNYTL